MASYWRKIWLRPPGGNAGSIFYMRRSCVDDKCLAEDELEEATLRGFGSASGSACGARGLCLSGLKAAGVPSSKGFSVLRFTGTAGAAISSGGSFLREPDATSFFL